MADSIRKQLEDFIRAQDRADGRQLREVGGAADANAIADGSAVPPAIYVMRGARQFSDNGQTLTQVDQLLVLIVVSNVRDPRGADSSDEAEAWSMQVQRWLKDFTPDLSAWADLDPRFHSLKLDRGNTQRWNDQLLVWGDVYQLKHHRRLCS